MRSIVRQAQKDFHFATIFEQRRTNGILVAGFANLGSAIEDMGSRIDGSIKTLTQTLESSMSAITDQNAEFHQESLAATEALKEQQASDAQAGREQSASNTEAEQEMLNNIQRRRLPLDKEYRDGQY